MSDNTAVNTGRNAHHVENTKIQTKRGLLHTKRSVMKKKTLLSFAGMSVWADGSAAEDFK